MKRSSIIFPSGGNAQATNQQPHQQEESYFMQAVKILKTVSEKAVINLGMIGSGVESSSESSDNFAYAMYTAGAAYMCCDLIERYSEMQNLGGLFQDATANLLKDTRESIINAVVSSVGIAGAVAISQTSAEGVEGADFNKQVPIAMIAGVATFLYMQSSKAIGMVSADKANQIHERKVAQPLEDNIVAMENAIKSATTNLNSATNPQQSAVLSQVQNQDLMQNFVAAVDSVVSKIEGLNRDVIKKDREVTNLLEQQQTLQAENLNLRGKVSTKDQEITTLSQNNITISERHHTLQAENLTFKEENGRLEEVVQMQEEDKFLGCKE